MFKFNQHKMKYWIEYTEQYEQSPLSFWVHYPVERGIPWVEAKKYVPSLPNKVIGKGYILYKVEHKGSVLVFSSLEEIEHCIEVLSKKVLPTTRNLANQSWVEGYQHLHWLTKWPSHIKKEKDRAKIIALLRKVKSY